MLMSKPTEKCKTIFKHNQTNCLFCNIYGICDVLKETDFNGKPCPFYKNKRNLSETEIAEYLHGVEYGFLPRKKQA